jgi:hypothetical protein
MINTILDKWNMFMASELFNSLSGYTVGIPPINVIDITGNLVTNVNSPNGNITANTVYANFYRYANGVLFNASAGGSNTQLQFNNNGAFSGIPNVTWNGSKLTLGNISNVQLTGGENGYFLQTDGTGNLSWVVGSGGGGNGTPGGSNLQVQFNDSGTFAGSPNFIFNNTTNLLTVGNIAVADISISGSVTAGGLSGNGNGLYNIQAPNIVGFIPTAQTVSNSAQPNITSLGQLLSLSVSGNATVTNTVIAGNLTAADGIAGEFLLISGNATVNGNLNIPSNATLRLQGNANFSNAPNVYLGPASNIHIDGGLNGYVLTTDGAGNVTWTNPGSGGNGAPAGANTQIQYNDTGAFGGSPFLTFNENTNTLNIGGNLIANSLTMGSGIYRFCTSAVNFSTTNSTSIDQPIFSIEASQVSALDITVISTDLSGAKRQVSKISAIVFNTTVNYIDYGSLNINGKTGEYNVIYVPGDIITAPTVKLTVTPASSNVTTHKMLVTSYEI